MNEKEEINLINEQEYKKIFFELKEKIKAAQIKAAVKVNYELLNLYWNMGKEIVEKQSQYKWGDAFVRSLSKDLRKEFPDIKGFSISNLKYVKKFYKFYEKGQQPVGQIENIFSIPWGHHILLITKCKNVKEAMFYIEKIITNGWSRGVLLNFLDADLYNAQGQALTNFSKTLPDVQSDLARETLKDPYNFDFLTLTEGYREKELEEALTTNITKFLLELGQGFAFVGRQVPIVVGQKEMFIDLLFYHIELRCYVVVELKITEFELAYIGQLGVYVASINHQRKKETDNETIGLLICKTKDNIVAEYALESSTHPIGISEYNLKNLLPKNYRSTLPSIDEIEKSIKEIEELHISKLGK